MSTKSIFLTILVLLIWGISTAVAKFAVLETSALIFLSVRSALAVCVFLPFAGSVSRRELKNLFFLGISMYVLHMAFFSAALKYLPVSSVIVIQQIQIPFAFLLSWLFFNEKITRAQAIGSIVAFMGVCVIFGLPHINFLGTAFMVLSGLFWAVSQIFMKRSAGVKPIALVAYMSLFSLPFLIAGSFIIDGNVIEKIGQADIFKFWGSLLYQLIFVNLSVVLWQQLVVKNGINKMSPFMLLQVVFSIFAGILMFHEVVSIQVIFGAILACVGVYITTRKSKKIMADTL